MKHRFTSKCLHKCNLGRRGENGDAYYNYANGRFENGDTYAAGVYAAANAAGDSSPGTPSNPARTESYVYDNAGNRTYDQETTVVRTPTYDGENRRSGFGYDPNGNVSSVPYGGGATVCTYDALNQLVSASCQGNTASFVYDGKGRLCQRTINGAPTNLYYAGDKIVEETNGSNGKTCTYYYGEAGQRACRVTAANSEAFYHYDGLGILTHLTNSSGTVIEQYMYTAYGTPLIYDATGTQSRNQTSTVLGQNRSVWLQGYEWYPELGLYRCGARFYEPYYGSFMQPDPIRQQGGLNVYGYCQNDPVNGWDPSGLDGAWETIKNWFSGVEGWFSGGTSDPQSSSNTGAAVGSPENPDKIVITAKAPPNASFAGQVFWTLGYGNYRRPLETQATINNGAMASSSLLLGGGVVAETIAGVESLASSATIVSCSATLGGAILAAESTPQGQEATQLAENTVEAAAEGATEATIETTAHGATRVAGSAATRGGVLSAAEITATQAGGTIMTQANGATVHIMQNAAGNFNVVVSGNRGIITTFSNISQNALDRLANNYGWQ